MRGGGMSRMKRCRIRQFSEYGGQNSWVRAQIILYSVRVQAPRTETQCMYTQMLCGKVRDEAA
jgi:hypothetical protein